MKDYHQVTKAPSIEIGWDEEACGRTKDNRQDAKVKDCHGDTKKEYHEIGSIR